MLTGEKPGHRHKPQLVWYVNGQLKPSRGRGPRFGAGSGAHPRGPRWRAGKTKEKTRVWQPWDSGSRLPHFQVTRVRRDPRRERVPWGPQPGVQEARWPPGGWTMVPPGCRWWLQCRPGEGTPAVVTVGEPLSCLSAPASTPGAVRRGRGESGRLRPAPHPSQPPASSPNRGPPRLTCSLGDGEKSFK